MNDHGIQKSLSELIEALAKVPSTLLPYANNALSDYLLELLNEQILDGREYSVISEYLQNAFLDVTNLSNPKINTTDGQLLHVTDAVELVDRISSVSTTDQEIECECDIGVFIDRIHREVKLGLTEEIELDFYRRWMSRALFNRPTVKVA